MHRKIPLPRGWKRRGRSAFLLDVILSLLDSTTNMPSLGRPESLNQYTDWQERAGLDQRHTFHRLRHTAVHQVYRATRDLLLTQRFARHSSLLVTSVYLHPSDEDLARSVQKIRC